MSLPKGFVLAGESIESGQSYLYRVRRKVGPDLSLLALKRLKNPDRRTRFEREVRAMETLHEKGIAIPEVVEKDVDDARPWFAMPWYEGGSLQKAVDGRWYREDRRAGLAILIDLAQIVAGVHAAELANRDLKPANVLFGNGGLLLTDFGLCLDLGDKDARFTQREEVIGSRYYIAPENESGMADEIDQRPADAYAFGKIISVVLGGRPPMARELELEPEHQLSNYLSDDSMRPIDRLIRELLSRDPRVRLSDFSVIRRELEAVASGERRSTASLTTHGIEAIARRLAEHPRLVSALGTTQEREQHSTWVSEVRTAMAIRARGLEEIRIRARDNREILDAMATTGGSPSASELADADNPIVRNMVSTDATSGAVVFLIHSPTGVDVLPSVLIRIWMSESAEGVWLNRVLTVASSGGPERIASFLSDEVTIRLGPFLPMRQTTLTQAVDLVDDTISLFNSLVRHYLEIFDEGGDPADAQAWNGRSLRNRPI